MVGRRDRRTRAALAGGIALTASVIFAVAASSPSAEGSGPGGTGGLMNRVRSGIRLLGGPGQQGLPTRVTIEAKSGAVLQREADQRARDPFLLQWGNVAFDPLKGLAMPEGVPAELASPSRSLPAALAAAPDDIDYWIVQYEGAVGEARKAIEDVGVDIVGVVPNFAYLVRADGVEIRQIEVEPMIRWTGRNLPAWKFDERALAFFGANADPSLLPLDDMGRVRLGIRLHAGLSDDEALAYYDHFKQVSGAELIAFDEREYGDPYLGRTVLLGMDPASVEDVIVQVAMLRDVAAIWSAEMPQPHNDHAVWFIQSGNDQVNTSDYVISAPLFAKGLTGRGLIGTIADSGLENDMCQFRYTNAKNDAAWVQGRSSNFGGGGSGAVPDEGILDLAAITPAERTRERKVVAYYVQSGAAAYSDAGQHGTAVAGCMAADNNTLLAARPLVRDLGERQNVRFWRTGGTWTPGQELRADLIPRVDVLPSGATTNDDPTIPNTFGLIEHHQAKDGMAPGAQIIFQDIGNASGQLSFTTSIQGMYDQASRTGAMAHNSSFGGGACIACYLGQGQDADSVTFSRRDLVGYVSAGNDGTAGASRTIGAGHAHAKNTVVVGWSNRGNSISCPTPASCPLGTTTRLGHGMSVSSSRGPSAGGQLAPTFALPGNVVSVAATNEPASNPETGTGTSDGGCGSPNPAEIGGTSFSSPNAAGAGLLVQQYFMDGYFPSGVPTPADAMRPTNALVKAILVNSARNLEGARTDDTGSSQAPRPNFGQGWGAPRLDDTLYFENDPKRGNPTFETERARLAILNDVPNGFDSTLAPEPGGKTRDQILNGFNPALTDRTIHEYFLDVINDSNGDGVPDPDDLANELRFTLAWSDVVGSSNAAPQVNNLDLEVVTPGPDGVLESSGVVGVRGDDIVYRPNPTTATWSQGYTRPSPSADITTAANIATPFTDTDLLNTVENVFIRSQDVVAGTYLVRVVARSIRGSGGTNGGYPNFALLDQAASRDTDGDGAPDIDEFDLVRGSVQGYALVASGNFTTDQGILSMNKSSYGCLGETLTLSLNDKNGGSNQPPCGTSLAATITTTTPLPSFPSDREPVRFTGTGPTYRSENPVTGAEGFEVRLVRNPADVIHGDGVVQVAHGETILAEYADNSPCGGAAFAQATISCQPQVQDQGFVIADGCDYAEPGNPASGPRPDGFMDRGELNRYQMFVANVGGSDLTDAVVSLYPDPLDPFAREVQVLNSPQNIGLMPPGRIADATFFVQVGNLVPPRHEMNFIVEVVSPRDGLLFPATFTQTQTMEADVVSFRYDTRDPNGELYKRGRIEILKPGVEEIPGGNPDADYVTNEPMWWDPDANNPADCDVPRNLWPDPMSPPFACTANGNPTNPWDFDDTNDGWFEAAHDGDDALMGVDFPALWDWKAAPTGGGCGWEDELHEQLATGSDPLPVGHPDRIAQPWGIWHSGAINPVNAGPFAGDVTNNQGVPFFDSPTNPNDHTIMWDPPPAGGVDNNSTGQWCTTYLSNPAIGGTFYRSMLMAPELFRVHASNPAYRVEFQQFQWYARLDAHTRNGDNLMALGWFVNNQPVAPSSTSPLAYTWDQFQYFTNIFSDKVRNDWSVDDNTLGDNLRNPNEDFAYLTYEDIFGPAADSWNIAFGLTHIHLDGYRSRGQYGAGIDDVSFVWTESRDDADGSDCGLVAGGQRPIIWFNENRYNACQGTLRINLWAPAETKPVVAVSVASAAEDVETALLYPNPATGRYEGEMAFTSDTDEDAVGVLLVSAGLIDIGSGADNIRVEYDPGTDSDPATDPAERADWCDIDGNEINDDSDGDGVPDCEDDPTSSREVRDFSVINCTSGRLFYIKHELQQVGPGDNDRFADPGETHRMKVYLVSALGADLEDVEVRISSDDPVAIVNDTLTLATLPGNGTLVDTGFGFEFCVPLGLQTTSLDQPRTITFRIDVRGRNTTNLNEFSTAGESFNSFLPLEAWLLVDVDAVATNPDYIDSVHAAPPPAGTFYEGFNSDPLGVNQGLDHYLAPAFQPGLQVLLQSTTSDTRYGMAGNSGFCPECDVQDDCSVTSVPPACDYYFSTDPAFTPGYDLSLDPPWNHTEDWAHEGTGAFKFGQLNAGPAVDDQHYPQGVYASLQLPPLRLSSTFAQPELTFWQIANIWGPFFTNGLFTPIDGFVVEIAPSAVGVGDTGVGDDRLNRSQPNRITQRFPLSNFRRLSPYEGLYDWETDALNACRTLFCRYKHPVFAFQGSPTISPASPTDPERGVPGTSGTWKFSRIDLSDYRGMEVVIQFSAEVLQDLEVQNGSIGWLLDDVRITGISNRVAMRVQDTNLTTEACGIRANFTAADPSCHGEDVQFYERHEGVGQFDTSVSPSVPYPLEFEWIIGGLTLRGFAGQMIPAGTPGVFGTFDNPRINLQTSAANVASPSNVSVTLRIYQNGALQDTITKVIVSKDAPVPVIQAVPAAYAGGLTQFTATATFDTSLDPDRTLYWEWDFDDGTGVDASGPSVQHVFDAPGTYDVTVRVYDEEGCTGTDTLTVTVTDAPRFELPRVNPAPDPDCGAPFGGDNNADIEELVTVNVDFRNAAGAANATGVVGYLTTLDPLVEIVTGSGNFGDVAAGAQSASLPFRFIRHDDGIRPAPSCLVLSFQLTLVANGGSVIQVLDLSFTMGQAAETSFDNVGSQTGGFTRNPSTPSSDDEVYLNVPAGCLTGLELAIDLTSTGQATVGDMKVDIISPDGDSTTVQYATGPNDQGPYTIHFRFGASNASGPIPDLAGQLELVGGTVLDPTVEATLVSDLVGKSMAGTWTIRVSSQRLGTVSSTYAFTIREFKLEGTNSTNLEIGNVLDCTDACFAGTQAPVFSGARASCDVPDTVLFSPAEDTWSCGGADDVRYEIWASTVPGELGTRVDGTAREVANCAACTDPNGGCAVQNPDGATFWQVCNTETVYWTVIAVDGGGARTPNIGAASPSVENPGAFQTGSVSCALPIDPPGVFSIVKSSTTAAAAWLTPVAGRTWPLGPPANATEYRILRGTFPPAGAGRVGLLGSRATPYDHVVRPGDCAFTTLSRDVTADLTLAGSYYYLVPGVNSRGCGGMGYDSQGNPIPGTGTGCAVAPDCSP